MFQNGLLHLQNVFSVYLQNQNLSYKEKIEDYNWHIKKAMILTKIMTISFMLIYFNIICIFHVFTITECLARKKALPFEWNQWLPGTKRASQAEYTYLVTIVSKKLPLTTIKEDKKNVNKKNNIKKGVLVCSGTLVHESWVITNAFCFNNNQTNEDYVIFVGVLDQKRFENPDAIQEQQRNILSLVRHPKYDPKSDEYNIAMIKLDKPVVITRFVNVAILPREPYSFKGDESCHILRYAKPAANESELLYQIILRPIDWIDCMDKLKLITGYSNIQLNISKNNFCLIRSLQFIGTTGACFADQGGPCICGIVFQGVIARTNNDTCFMESYPTTIVDVGSHLDWIRKELLDLQIVSPRNCGNIAIISVILISIVFTFYIV